MHYVSSILRLSRIGLVLAAGLAMASTAAAENTPTEAANKKIVLGFYAALNEADATNSMKRAHPGHRREVPQPGVQAAHPACCRVPAPTVRS